MDPVHKWLTVVILFMIAVVFAAFKIGGSGRWEMQVIPYSTSHDMVYMLDTKTGKIVGKMHDRRKHLSTNGDGNSYAYESWETVHSPKTYNSYGRSRTAKDPIILPR